MSIRADANTQWYCRWHLATLDDPLAAANVLDDLERNPPRRSPDWREELVRDHLERHKLRRQPDESLAAFKSRCKAAMPAGPLDLSMDRRIPSKTERIEGLVERFGERIARNVEDGMDVTAAERAAVESIAEALLPG